MAMASSDPVNMLQNEVLCPICQEYLKDPVTIDCGHNYCRACVTQDWKNVRKMFSCPQCRQAFQKRNFMTNWQLANVVEIVKQIRIAPPTAHSHHICEKHEEVAKLYCEEDEAAICLVCQESREHKSHTVVPLEEAVQESKEKLTVSLPPLNEDLDEIVKHLSDQKKKIEDWKKTVETQRQRIVAEFEDLYKILYREETALFNKLKQQSKVVMKTLNGNVIKLSKQYYSVDMLVMEINEMCAKPAVELLRDISLTLNRCANVKCLQPEDISVDVEWSAYNIPEFCTNLRKGIQQYKHIVFTFYSSERELVHPSTYVIGASCKDGNIWPLCWKRTVEAFMAPVGVYETLSGGSGDVTMDPNTANQELQVSEDQKSIIWNDTKQEAPNNPERFQTMLCTLASQGFIEGRHYWEVNVGGGMEWALGVAGESVKRKGWIDISPEEHIWAMGLHCDQYHALTSPDWNLLHLEGSPQKIAIFLDHEGRQLSFYNADDMSHIYTFTKTFSEKIFPFFHTLDKQVPVCICA